MADPTYAVTKMPPKNRDSRSQIADASEVILVNKPVGDWFARF